MKKLNVALAVAAALTGTMLSETPAGATHDVSPSDYDFADPRGDAGIQADLTWGSVWYAPAGSHAYAVTVRMGVRDVRDSGRYEVFFSSDYDYGIATLIKDPGRAPRATFVKKYAFGGEWKKVSCPIGTAWDLGRNYVSLRLPPECFGLFSGGEHDTAPYKVRYSSQGAADTAVAKRPATFTKSYYDQTGDAPARADIRSLKHVRQASHVSLNVYVTDLPDEGRYVVETGAHRLSRIVVRKERGKPPVATIARGVYDDGWHWRRMTCTPGVAWDAARNYVAVWVPHSTSAGAECPSAYLNLWDENLAYGLMDVGGATDVVRR